MSQAEQLWDSYKFRRGLGTFCQNYLKDEDKAFEQFKQLFEVASGQEVPVNRARNTPLISEIEEVSDPAGQERHDSISETTKKHRGWPKGKKREPKSKEEITVSKQSIEEIKASITPAQKRQIKLEDEANKVDINERIKASADILLGSIRSAGFDENGTRKVLLANHRYAGSKLNEYMQAMGYKIMVKKSMQAINSGSNGESGAGSATQGWEVVVTQG